MRAAVGQFQVLPSQIERVRWKDQYRDLAVGVHGVRMLAARSVEADDVPIELPSEQAAASRGLHWHDEADTVCRSISAADCSASPEINELETELAKLSVPPCRLERPAAHLHSRDIRVLELQRQLLRVAKISHQIIVLGQWSDVSMSAI
jgi:hypothetical protein